MSITPLRLALAAVAVTAPMAGTATGRAQAADAAGPPVPALLAALDADKDGRLTLEELDADREQQLARFDPTATAAVGGGVSGLLAGCRPRAAGTAVSRRRPQP